MDDNIKTPRDALLWLERFIRTEAELDGEMTNEHAIQLGFITKMLEKFPHRKCYRFKTAAEAIDAYQDSHHDRLSVDSTSGEWIIFLTWLFGDEQPETERGDRCHED